MSGKLRLFHFYSLKKIAVIFKFPEHFKRLLLVQFNQLCNFQSIPIISLKNLFKINCFNIFEIECSRNIGLLFKTVFII